MTPAFRPLANHRVTLNSRLFQRRFEANRSYVKSLKSFSLLQNHYLEAGLWTPIGKPEDAHWGWESPTCQFRGQFLGHWLSAAAHICAITGDLELKGKADFVVSEVARCQAENGGEWAGSIPEKYMDWLARGKPVWSPQCTIHRNMMGLFDMYAWAGNAQALEILVRWARWFSRWTAGFTREQFDNILDVETGGMLEVWSDLYAVTGAKEHRELIKRYDRPRLFDPLLAGRDPLTNRHANTTIPEALGAARAWEVTGEERWRQVVEAYWRCAVTDRGYYCTGGQTNGEFWTAPYRLAVRLGDKNQEHCTVYHLMRLADYLLRWTGDAAYADYWERNLYNGTLAQQHPETGMPAYFLPLRSGSVKKWGTPEEDFWCCHGTMIQAHSLYPNHVFRQEGPDLVLSQYIPCTLEWSREGGSVGLSLTEDMQPELYDRPCASAYDLRVTCAQPQEFTLKFRLPWWLDGGAEVTVNGERQAVLGGKSTYAAIRRAWLNDTVRITLSHRVTLCPLPDRPDTAAFMDGPVVLAGVLAAAPAGQSTEYLAEKALYYGEGGPASILVPDNDREFTRWRIGYKTSGQAENVRLIPLYEIRDEPYQVYFPLAERGT